MSWYHDKITVKTQPVVMRIAGNITVAIGDGKWIYLGPTESWEDFFQMEEISEEDKIDYNKVETFKVKSSTKDGEYTVSK